MKTWRDLTSKQQKYIESGALMFVFLSLTFGFYIPALKDVKKTKAENAAVNADIDRIELLAGQSRDIKEGLQALQEQIAAFDRRFPDKEERGLKTIADSARNNQLEIVSTRIGNKRESVDQKNKPLLIQEKKCQEIPVALQLQGHYQNVVQYLQDLNDNPDYFVTIERLNLERGAGEGVLKIEVDLKLYILV